MAESNTDANTETVEEVAEATAAEAAVEGQEPAVIDDLTDSNRWEEWIATGIEWVQENVLVTDTLIELAVIVACAAAAWPLARVLRSQLERLNNDSIRHAVLARFWQTCSDLIFPFVWLLIQFAVSLAMTGMGFRVALLTITTSLLTAWIIIHLLSAFVANPFLRNTIAMFAWVIAALNILGVLEQTEAALDSASFSLGQVTVSALTVIQGVIALGILLWLTSLLGQIIESRLNNSPNLTPSIRVLSTKILRIVLVAAAFLLALSIVGVDLTALAVFGGAIGIGLGFGLQKIFANLVSGFILLLDKSIKPGDTIAVPEYYGRVDSLGARYVSVTTRDGIEHLIPNEELITTRVENWTHSNSLLRLKKVVGVHYDCDLRKARELCLEAASECKRILSDPGPVCLIKDFGDSSVNLEVRFWVNDPMNGRANVTSDLLQRIWDKFHEEGIEIPYPQRDIHLRSSELKS